MIQMAAGAERFASSNLGASGTAPRHGAQAEKKVEDHFSLLLQREVKLHACNGISFPKGLYTDHFQPLQILFCIIPVLVSHKFEQTLKCKQALFASSLYISYCSMLLDSSSISPFSCHVY